MEQHQRQPHYGTTDRHHSRRSDAFGAWVSRQVRVLTDGGRDATGIRHEGYLQNGSYATAAVAKLRRAVGHEVGADSDIFMWTMPPADDINISGNVAGYVNEPSPRERAAHAAITLFAVHQQSNHETSAHTDENVSLGRAVGRLAYGNYNEPGIRSLFDRLQTSSSWKELIRHTRSVVGLLKRKRIAINYGLLAQDLLDLRAGRDRANAVRIRWGREFLRAYRYEQVEDERNAQVTSSISK